MAEAMGDEDARQDCDEVAQFDRRAFVRSVGAAGISAAALGTGTASAADFRTVSVSAGETRTFRLGGGDALEDTLIDITADGAEYRILAEGSGWSVSNVGVKGRFDTNQKLSAFVVQGDGAVENVYLGDGGGGESTGLYVHADHAGRITIDRANVRGWPDNGIYASSPGNGSSHPNPGRGGTVEITDCYGADNGTSNFRIGTSESVCENCVAVGGDRGFWGYYERTEYVGCSASGAGEQFRAGADAWPKSTDAVVVLDDSHADGTLNSGPGTVEGEPGSSPETSPPSGVPSSAEAAARGE